MSRLTILLGILLAGSGPAYADGEHALVRSTCAQLANANLASTQHPEESGSQAPLVTYKTGKLSLSTSAIDLVIRELIRTGWNTQPAEMKKRPEAFAELTQRLLGVELEPADFVKRAQRPFTSWTIATAPFGTSGVDPLDVLRAIAASGITPSLRNLKVTDKDAVDAVLKRHGIEVGAAAFVDGLMMRHQKDWSRVLTAARLGALIARRAPKLTPVEVVHVFGHLSRKLARLDEGALNDPQHQELIKGATLAVANQSLSGQILLEDSELIYGSLLAALEYSGIDSLALINDTEDLEDWTPTRARSALGYLRTAKIDLSFEQFFLQHEAISGVLEARLGKPVSAYSVWRAAMNTTGSWSEAVSSLEKSDLSLDEIAHGLFKLVTIFPKMNKRDIDSSDAKLAKQVSEGLDRTVTASQIYRKSSTRFGALAAGLEYAGFNTSRIAVLPLDPEEWTKNKLMNVLQFLVANHISLDPAAFFTNHDRVQRLLLHYLGKPVTAYHVWCAVYDHFGSWSSGVRSVDETLLIPERFATADRVKIARAPGEDAEKFWTLSKIAKALRAIADHVPAMTTYELSKANSAAVEAIRQAVGVGVEPQNLLVIIRQRFGSFIAALEYAGFDTSHIHGGEQAILLEKETTAQVLQFLDRQSVEFTPERFFAIPGLIGDLVETEFGVRPRPYDLWRSAILGYGSWPTAVRVNSPTSPVGKASTSHGAHAAFWRERLDSGRAAGSSEWTPKLLGRVLRFIHRKFPAMSADAFQKELSSAIFELTTETGHPVRGSRIVALAMQFFGSWPAALEYAGIDTTKITNYTADSPELPGRLPQILRLLYSNGVSLAPEDFLLAHERIAEIVQTAGLDVSAYSVWRAAIARSGSWLRAITPIAGVQQDFMQSVHPSIWENKLQIVRVRKGRSSEADLDLEPEVIAYVLRFLATKYPSMTVATLTSHSYDVFERLQKQLDLSLSGAELCRQAILKFGVWVAALEFSGFDTREQTNTSADHRIWTYDKLVFALKQLLDHEVDLSPEAFLTQNEVVESVLGVSAFSVWRAGLKEFGSWPKAIAEVQKPASNIIHFKAKLHPSIWTDRIPLFPNFTLEEEAERARWLYLLDHVSVPASAQAVVATLRAYLETHASLNDWDRVDKFFGRTAGRELDVSLLPLVLERLEHQFSHFAQAAE